MTINPDGSISGTWSNRDYENILDECFSLDVVPVIVTSHLTNWLRNNRVGEDIAEDMMRNFFNKLASWLQANHPDKFFMWNPACEFNYPPDISSSRGRTVDPELYNPKMRIIRKARDDLGLQNKILLGLHANLGWWAMDTLEEHLANFAHEQPYYEGFALNDIIGFSHYQGYLEPSHNPNDADWKTTVEYAWRRAKLLLDAIDPSKPFMWMEYSHGNPWKYEKEPIWSEAVRFTYETMVKNNSWCKGLNWYVGEEIQPDAMALLVLLADQFNNYGYTLPATGGCFIATACGTSNTHLDTLRSFRDRFLPHRLVDAYYLLSPPVADRIRRHENVKRVIRGCVEWSTCRLKKSLTL